MFLHPSEAFFQSGRHELMGTSTEPFLIRNIADSRKMARPSLPVDFTTASMSLIPLIDIKSMLDWPLPTSGMRDSLTLRHESSLPQSTTIFCVASLSLGTTLDHLEFAPPVQPESPYGSHLLRAQNFVEQRSQGEFY